MATRPTADPFAAPPCRDCEHAGDGIRIGACECLRGEARHPTCPSCGSGVGFHYGGVVYANIRGPPVKCCARVDTHMHQNCGSCGTSWSDGGGVSVVTRQEAPSMSPSIPALPREEAAAAMRTESEPQGPVVGVRCGLCGGDAWRLSQRWLAMPKHRPFPEITLACVACGAAAEPDLHIWGSHAGPVPVLKGLKQVAAEVAAGQQEAAKAAAGGMAC